MSPWFAQMALDSPSAFRSSARTSRHDSVDKPIFDAERSAAWTESAVTVAGHGRKIAEGGQDTCKEKDTRSLLDWTVRLK
ncbi:hypothetical protein L596_007118 [Steinernema carpocapsae]|uniref:Uncharacterized protein n=1 Tax=Steinernema carpocapsae TaxID=34508 RepID=A0A4U5P899_STECR|nr:hypothetical protein L596_007118 [Steinernema carpocapsae]